MNIDEIGALYNVHRSTIARWRAACREALAERTRAILVAELNISTEDLDSLVRLIQSQFDVSLYRLLESSGDAPPGSRNVE